MRFGGVHAPASDRRRVALASVARAPYVHASPFAQTIVSPSLREQLQATLEGSYTLERELGGGGMSRVFVAEETSCSAGATSPSRGSPRRSDCRPECTRSRARSSEPTRRGHRCAGMPGSSA